jgi:hypothetical protein
MELIAGIILFGLLFGIGGKEKTETKIENNNKIQVKTPRYTVVGKGMNRKLRDNKTGMYIVT